MLRLKVEITKNSRVRPKRIVSPLVALSLAVATGSAATVRFAEAKVLTCLKLEQNCTSYAAHRQTLLSHTRADQAARGDSGEPSAAQCQSLYAAALETGVFPAHGVTPALACTN